MKSNYVPLIPCVCYCVLLKLCSKILIELRWWKERLFWLKVQLKFKVMEAKREFKPFSAAFCLCSLLTLLLAACKLNFRYSLLVKFIYLIYRILKRKSAVLTSPVNTLDRYFTPRSTPSASIVSAGSVSHKRKSSTFNNSEVGIKIDSLIHLFKSVYICQLIHKIEIFFHNFIQQHGNRLPIIP